MLMHYPSLGIKSFVEVFSENGSQVVRVTRTVKRGFAAGWTLRFKGSTANRVEELVGELSAGMAVAPSCPRRGVRDGVSWGVRIQRVEWGIDFKMNDGGPACARLEAAAIELMSLAKLKCRSTVCLRPEEEASGRLTCAPGESGDECRQAASGSD
jgi:hypothetical protein